MTKKTAFHSLLALLTVCLSSSLLLACLSSEEQKDSGDKWTPQDSKNEDLQDPGTPAGISIRFHSNVPNNDKARVNQGLRMAEKMKVDPKGAKYYDTLFGNTPEHPNGVLHFIDERTQYIIGSETYVAGESLTDPGTGAANMGAALWMQSIVLHSDSSGRVHRRSTMDWDGETVAIENSRTGVIWIGPAFGYGGEIGQLSTLIHEGRHSDCPGGLDRENVLHLKRFSSVKNKKCMHLHQKCPYEEKYGSLQGKAACDGVEWGPYGIAAYWAYVTYHGCQNCSEADKSVLETLFAENALRLQNGIAEKMVNETLSMPDPSSKGLTEN